MSGKLSYFGVGGRAEAIRALMAHAGKTFENNVVESNAEMKASGYSPMGGLPLWDQDGFVMCGSNAILRRVGMEHGYYSTDATIAFNIDSLCEFQEDIVGMFVQYIMPKMMGGELGDQDKFMTFWTKQSDILEARLAAGKKKFAAGTDKPTIADFKLFAQVSYGLASINTTACMVPEDVQAQVQAIVDSHPMYKKWIAAMTKETASWVASRPAVPL